MKINHKEPEGFQPFTITVETEEEARVIWHRMNTASGSFREHCVGSQHLNGLHEVQFDEDDDAKVTADVWNACDKALGRGGFR